MNPILRQIINQRINNLTVEQLIELSYKYQVSLTRQQAIKIIQILKRENIDIVNEVQRERLLKQIWKEVGPNVKIKVKKLLDNLLKLS